MRAAGVGMGAAGMAGATPTEAAPTLTQIYDMIYSVKCAVCHSMAPSDNANGKLGMIRSKDQFYQAIVGKPTQGSQCTGKGMYVVPSNPAQSVLVQKTSQMPPCGMQMPLGGMLEPAQVKLLIAWISAGAVNN
jgi:mono/diheme cytochrome c family protein